MRVTPQRTLLQMTQNIQCPWAGAYDWSGQTIQKPVDYWSCIAHLSTEDMLKSAVIEEKKFKTIEFVIWIKVVIKVNEWPWPLVLIKIHVLI